MATTFSRSQGQSRTMGGFGEATEALPGAHETNQMLLPPTLPTGMAQTRQGRSLADRLRSKLDKLRYLMPEAEASATAPTYGAGRTQSGRLVSPTFAHLQMPSAGEHRCTPAVSWLGRRSSVGEHHAHP